MASQIFWMYGAGEFLGQRVYAPTLDAFNPVAVGPIGQVTPAPIPTVVPPGSIGNLAPSSMNNAAADVSAASSAPFSLAQSPVIIFAVFLIVALLGLRYIHFRG